MTSLLRELSGPMMARGAGAALALGFHVLLARMTDPAIVGRYALAFVLIWLLAMIGRMGLDGVLARHMARIEDGATSKHILSLQISIAAPAMAGSLAMSGIAFFVAEFLGNIFDSPELSPYIKIMAIGLAPLSATLLIAEAFRGLGKHTRYTFFSTACLNLMLVIIIIILAYFIDATEAAPWAFALASLLSAAIGVAVTFRILSNRHEGTASPQLILSYRKFLPQGLPLLVAGLLELSLQITGLVVLGLFGTDDDVGVMRIVLRTAMIVSLLIFVVNAIVSRKVARHYDSNDLNAIVVLCRRMTMVTICVSLPICTAMAVIPSWVLLVFGAEFTRGASALSIITVGFLLTLATGPTSTALVMTGHGRLHRNTIAAAAALNIIANILLTPPYGLVGSALAFALAVALQAILATVAVRKLFGGSFFPSASTWRDSWSDRKT